MSKTTKVQRKALDAIDGAEAAAKQARKVAKALPGKSAKKLREIAAETFEDVDVSKKALKKDPGKITKKAQHAEQRVRRATRLAIVKAEKKARARAEAERAAAESAKAAEDAKARAAESKALKKLAAKAERAAAKAEKEAAEADRLLEAALVPDDAVTDAAAATSAGGTEAEPGTAPKRVVADDVAVPGSHEGSDAPEATSAEPPAGSPAAPARPRSRRSTPAKAATSGTLAKAATSGTPAKAAKSGTPAPRTRATRAKAPAPAELDALTVLQLRERARASGRTGYSRLTKAELIALLS